MPNEDCMNCGPGYPAVIDRLCADCLNDREQERIDRMESKRAQYGRFDASYD